MFGLMQWEVEWNGYSYEMSTLMFGSLKIEGTIIYST